MSISTYNVIIGICAFFIVFIPFTGDAFNKQRPLFKKITLRGWVILMISVFGVWASVKKDETSSDEQDQKDRRFKRELHDRDLAFQQKFSYKDSIDNDKISKRDETHKNEEADLQKFYTSQLLLNSRKNLTTYTGALAKYNLQYVEGQNKVVQMLRDSTRGALNIPFVDLCKYPTCTVDPIGIEKINMDTISGYIKFSNSGQPAFNMNIATVLVPEIEGRLNNALFIDITKHKRLGANEISTFHFNFNFKGDLDIIYYYFKGTYENSEGIPYPISGVYKFSLKEKKFIGQVGLEEQASVTGFLKWKKIIN